MLTRPTRYRIRVQGRLGPEWTASFGGLALTWQAPGETVLMGQVTDQAALHHPGWPGEHRSAGTRRGALILGTIVLNLVVVQLLLGMAASITTVLNVPGSVVQTATNTTISGLNTVSGFFGGSSSVSSVQIPLADGIQIISNTLTAFHLPTIAVLSQ